MAVLGAILVLLVVHADAVSVKSSFKLPWCDRDDDGARECKYDDADEAGLAADASSIFSSSFNNFDSDGTAKKLPHHRRPDRREEGRLLPDHLEHRGGGAYR